MARPELYHQPSNESPVRADPDDLLLLAGQGLAGSDRVVYRAVRNTNATLTTPDQVPAASDSETGVAPIVSSEDAPYALTVLLPRTLRAGNPYALWVRTERGDWSLPVMINDARPLWLSPGVVFASASPDSLPRELKIIGRNLRSSTGRPIQIRLNGPQRFTATAMTDPARRDGTVINEYAARISLPGQLVPGRYRISVNRDGVSWVEMRDQSFEVLRDPPPTSIYSISEPRFGDCRPDDGRDDTACIVRAIAAAAAAGGGIVQVDAGDWELIDPGQPGVISHEGMVVPDGVQLRGAGSGRTRLNRHAEWNARGATSAFTLVGHTSVSGFTFRDVQIYHPGDQAGAYLQLGENWRRIVRPLGEGPGREPVVSDVTISRNIFDKPFIAIGSGGMPISGLHLTYNTFGAYHAALEFTGDQYNTVYKFSLDDSIIDYNVFKPGSDLDLINKSGAIASELGAGRRVDFSNNTADGSSTEFLNAPDDPKGWRAVFFWTSTNNVEEVLVSQNTATCTGDKVGDGEAIAFDSNTNTFAFAELPTVSRADRGSVSVSAPLISRQHNQPVPVADYYVGHWIQIVSGPGLGQVRKITGYMTDAASHMTTFRVAPDWDVVPVPGGTRIAVGREYWQLYVVDNWVDNRTPLCEKSNRSRRAGGAIGLWAQTADTVFAGNHQFDSDGIFAQQNAAFVTQNYGAIEPSLP